MGLEIWVCILGRILRKDSIMSEIKPVYLIKKLFLGGWEEVSKEKFESMNCFKWIVFSAAALEALQAENELLNTQVLCVDMANKKLRDENAELKEDLQFVERWANHHGTKPNVTAQESLSCIQHYHSIAAITKGYKDGMIPNTRNPYAELAAQAKRISDLENDLVEFNEFKKIRDSQMQELRKQMP